jgi:hypothetical protein
MPDLQYDIQYKDIGNIFLNLYLSFRFFAPVIFGIAYSFQFHIYFWYMEIQLVVLMVYLNILTFNFAMK